MAYIARTTVNGIYRNPYWFSKNPFYNAGYGMPNCTTYAWGRFWENSDTSGDYSNRPNLSTGNARDWYGHTADGYSRGSTPALGAIACYNNPRGGHVCVVERIDSDGCLVSESGWNSYFFRASHKIGLNGYYGSGYDNVFQGFIYNPVVGGGGFPFAPDGWTFTPRLTSAGMKGNPYWYSKNDCYTVRHHALPNCTTYAWGRWFEILDPFETYANPPVLPTSNARYWWTNGDGYERGSTPEIGAIMCWDGGLGGHVAVVEGISDDGLTLTCSQSGYESKRYFYISHPTYSNGTWHWANGFTFQGFIYNPFIHGYNISFFKRLWLFKREWWNRDEEQLL